MNIFIRLIFRRLYKHPAVFFTKIFGFTIGFAILFFAVAYYLNEINYNKSFIEKHNIFQIFYSNQGVNSYRPFLPKQLSHEVEQIPEINAVTSINDQGVVVNLNNDYFFYRSLAVTDSDFFSVFNIDFIYGDKKQFKQKPNSLIITEEIASKHFGAANPIGKEIEVGRYENMKSYEITGVIENWPVKSTIQADMVMKKKALNAGNTTEMFFSSEKNITQVQLNKKINLVLSDRLDKTDKSYRQVSNSSVFEAVPIQNLYFLPSNYKIADNKGDKFLLSTILLLAIGIFIIVLVNNTILDIGFIITKLKEMGIRKINGAKSFHIFIIQIRENIVILSIAVILSVILLFILNVPVTGILYPEWIADAKGNSLFNIDDTWLILLSFIGISLFTMIVVSIITLIFVNRSQSIALIQSKGNRKMTYPNYTGSLVILQVVISMILISGVIMVYKQLYYTANKDYGYHLTNVFYADVQLKTSSELREELMQHPDIEYVTFFFLPTREVIRPGKKIYQLSKPTKKYNIAKFYADYYYTETFGMQIIEGRSFKPEHHDKEEDRILVNETAARQMNLFGKIPVETNQGTVIGIVNDFHMDNLKKRIEPIFITFSPSTTNGLCAKVRPEDAPGRVSTNKELTNWLTKMFKKHSPSWYKMYSRKSFRPQRDGSVDIKKGLEKHNKWNRFGQKAVFNYTEDKTIAKIGLFLAILSIALSSMGLYGLSTIFCYQRTKEVGIRKVNGAKSKSILRLFTKDYLKKVIIAMFLALPISYIGVQRYLETFAYHTNISWWVFLLSVLCILLFLFIAVGSQSWRTARRNPVESLRYE